MYKLHKSLISNEINFVIRLADGANIPINPDNTDYQEYLKWLALGNAPLPAEEV